MEWIRDISKTPFLWLCGTVLLLVAAFLCANYGKKKGYSYWLCFFGCLLGQLPGIITVLLLPDITALEDQLSSSIRYRDQEIESLKKRLAQLEDRLKDDES